MLARVLPILVLTAIPALSWADDHGPNLRGAWVTPLAEQTVAGTSGHVRERLVFEETHNTISIEVFADAEAQVPLFTYASRGPYRILGPSPTVDGAWMLDAENEISTVTVFQDAPQVWTALNLSACPLEIGVAVDIADCVSGPPFNAADCVELDLVARADDMLRLGTRDTDRCIDRPGSLGSTAYSRQ